MPIDQTSKSEISTDEQRPDWAESFADDWRTIDVRTQLAEGKDPFDQIMKFLSDLPREENFAVEAFFNPQPLRRLLAARGYASFGEQMAQDHWRILFHPENVIDGLDNENNPEPRTWNEEKVLHVDLRGMEPPGPLVFILGLLDRPGMGKELIVHLGQDPVYLYPELNERNWDWDRLKGDEDEIRLRLFRPISD